MIIFDIGAGIGNYSIPLAKKSSDNIIYAFEPVQNTSEQLRLKTKDLSNFYIFTDPINNIETLSKFYICGSNNFRFSSLLKISHDALNNWPGIYDLQILDTIKLHTISLESFIDDHSINQNIDYLNVSSNGNDLNIIKSLGKYVNMILAGSIIASISENILYTGQNTLNESIEYLQSNNFKISNVQPNDSFGNQVRIDFKQ